MKRKKRYLGWLQKTVTGDLLDHALQCYRHYSTSFRILLLGNKLKLKHFAPVVLSFFACPKKERKRAPANDIQRICGIRPD
jgi:hypothetical protein